MNKTTPVSVETTTCGQHMGSVCGTGRYTIQVLPRMFPTGRTSGRSLWNLLTKLCPFLSPLPPLSSSKELYCLIQSPPMLHSHLQLHVPLTRRTNAKPGNLPKGNALSEIGERGIASIALRLYGVNPAAV